MVSMFIGPLVVPLDLWQPTGLDPAYFHTCDSDAPLVDNADAVTAPLPYILLWMLWHWDMSPPAQKGGASTVSTAGKPPLQYPILACEFWKRTSISDYTHNIYIYVYTALYIYIYIQVRCFQRFLYFYLDLGYDPIWRAYTSWEIGRVCCFPCLLHVQNV